MRSGIGVLFAAVLVGCFSDHAPAGPGLATFECAIPAEALRRGDRLVFIRDFAFLPDTLRVASGETVTWINCEPLQAEAHTSTADGGEWASPLMRSGETFSHTFRAKGSFGYFCLPHRGMRGTVLVQ
jgi:plastocyanin